MAQKIERIVITGQMLKGDTLSSRWIFNLFSYYIKRVTGLNVYLTTLPNSYFFNTDSSIIFNAKEIYDAYNIDFDYQTQRQPIGASRWAQIYNKTEYNKEAYDYIYSIFKDSLVISYELEDCVLSALEHFDIPYIEINLDPIRFLEDIMLCFRTSNPQAYEKILKYRVDEELLYLNANYTKCFYKTMDRTVSSSNDVLFLGQTTCDKTIVDKENQEIYSILNHKEDFLNSVSGFDNIYYKRHPLVQNDDEIMRWVKSLPNVEIIDDNFYSLISKDNIKKVVSISSGTCAEASYFGKEVQYLLKQGVPRQTVDVFDKDKYVSVFQDFFSLNFWSDILEPFVKTEKFEKEITIAGSRNKLRNSRIAYPVYYAYEDPDHLVIQKQTDNKVFEKVQKSFFAYELENNEALSC